MNVNKVAHPIEKFSESWSKKKRDSYNQYKELHKKEIKKLVEELVYIPQARYIVNTYCNEAKNQLKCSNLVNSLKELTTKEIITKEETKIY
jgi:competence protein ComGF